MNLKEIKELLNLVVEKGISEFELERGGARLRIKRGVNSLPEGSGADYDAPRASLQYSERIPLPQDSRPVGALPAPPAAEREAVSAEGLHLVKSPIVGTFYEAPSPGAEPFVRVGDQVEVGQTLCIIEAMKLMNEIESDVAGEIVKCYVTSGQPVEYGETLFAIRPSRKK